MACRGAEAIGFQAEGAAEVAEAIAKRLVLGTLGPEQASQPVPLHLGSASQCEQGEEPLALGVAEAWERAAVEPDLERPEQVNTEQEPGAIRP
jgi:hypothetical protein